jgi:hypothetical protein
VFYAGKELWKGKHRVGVCQSTDDGQTWRWLAELPVRPGDSHEAYHELHAVETARGRLIVHVRNHNRANNGETLQSESSDGGKTWSVPHAIGVWGLPSHLLRLKDGRLAGDRVVRVDARIPASRPPPGPLVAGGIVALAPIPKRDWLPRFPGACPLGHPRTSEVFETSEVLG